MKKAILVHGWDGTPDDGWFSWLKGELEQRGFEVIAPQLPDADSPHISSWVPALASAVETADQDTYFIGHSMGCQTIARYIETLPEGTKVGGAIFVAGFFRPLTGLKTEEEKEIDREWAQAPINFNKIKSHISRSVAIFSDNDVWVPLENAEDFKNNFDSEIIIQHNKSHFNEGAGINELPIVLEKLLEISNPDVKY